MMVQTCKFIGNVHTTAQAHMDYRPLDIVITVSSMIYYLGYVAILDPNQLAHQYGVSKSLEIRNLTSVCNTSLSTQTTSIILIRLSSCMC